MTPVHELQSLLFFTGAGCTLFGWFAGRAAMRRRLKAQGEEMRRGLEKIRDIVIKPFDITSINGKSFTS